MKYLVWMAIGYLSGSVLYGYLLPKLFRHIDVTKASCDGNPGTANAFLHAGVPIGMAALLLELAKGFVPVFFAAKYLDVHRPLFGLVLAAPVLGHAFPWWRRGGGKAIAVSFGTLLGLFPEWRPVVLLAFFYLLFSLVVVITPHFYRSVVTFALFSVGCLQMVGNRAIVGGCLLLSVVVVWKHLTNYCGERFGIRMVFGRHST